MKAKDKVVNKGTTALAKSLVGSSTPVICYGFSGYNAGPAQFIQVHNATAEPADGEVPKVVFPIAANGPFAMDWSPDGRFFSIGMVICNSSTGPTKTVGANDCWFDVQLSESVYK